MVQLTVFKMVTKFSSFCTFIINDSKINIYMLQ